MTPLDPADCKDVSPKNKSKSLLAAYEVAAEGHDLKYFKSLLADHQAAVQQEMDEAEAEENAKAAAKAEKAEKAKKTKRKSKGADTDVEMEDTDDKKPKSSKKRKNAEAEDEAEKVHTVSWNCFADEHTVTNSSVSLARQDSQDLNQAQVDHPEGPRRRKRQEDSCQQDQEGSGQERQGCCQGGGGGC